MTRILYPGHFEPPQQPPVTEGHWHQGWSEPVRQKLSLPAYQQQFLAIPTFIPEVVTVDKWFAPLSTPIPRVGITADKQQALALYTNPTVSFGWMEPLSEPVKRIGLLPSLQQFLTFAPSPLVSFGWYESLTDPPRLAKPTLPTASHQALALPVFTPTVQALFAPFAEPIRQKVGLSASQQQFLSLPATTPIPSMDWYLALAEPVRSRPKPPVSDYFFAPTLVTEQITADKWFAELAEPVRQKKSVLEGESQFIAVAARLKWFSPLAEPVRVKKPPISDYFFAPTQVAEQITIDKWFEPFADVVRRGGLGVALQQPLAFTPTQPDAAHDLAASWISPWSEPVRQKKGQPVYLDPDRSSFFVTPEIITPDKWFAALSEPVRFKQALSTANQQALSFSPTQPDIAKDLSASWISPLDQPIFRKRLNTSDYAFTPPSVQESITIDKWFAALSEPTRRKPSQYPFDFIPPRQPDAAQDLSAAWIGALSQPLFIKRIPISDYAFWTFTVFEIITPDKWFEPLSSPVQQRIFAVSQQAALAFSPNPIPTPIQAFTGPDPIDVYELINWG